MSSWSLASLTRSARQPSHLLELPAELRETIFKFALTSDRLVVTFRLDSYQRDSYQEATQPALTRVSRQIRNETLPLFYDCNNIILHTEGSKYDDAARWLICTEPYISHVRNATLWIRYIPFINERVSSQGALAISMKRPVKRGVWKVDDEWKWVTVVRKPPTLESDAKFLINHVKQTLEEGSTPLVTSRQFIDMMRDIREKYASQKTE